MKLADLLPADAASDARLAALEVAGVSADSRNIKPGDLFVAVAGAKADGLEFLPQVLAAGAAAVAPAVNSRPQRRLMISRNMEAALNGHITAEFYSAHLYLSMAAWRGGTGRLFPCTPGAPDPDLNLTAACT